MGRFSGDSQQSAGWGSQECRAYLLANQRPLLWLENSLQSLVHFLRAWQVLFHGAHYVAPYISIVAQTGQTKHFYVLAAIVGSPTQSEEDSEGSGIQLVEICNVTTRLHWILHTGPLNYGLEIWLTGCCVCMKINEGNNDIFLREVVLG